MKATELYNRTPESFSKDLNHLNGYDYQHVPEIQETWFDDDTNDKNEKVFFRIYKDFDFDGRRGWKLASVWFEDKPVMIIQNAGRELRDHADRFITDLDGYIGMVKYIRSLLPVEHVIINDVIDPSEERNDLDSFYGNSLDGVFERY